MPSVAVQSAIPGIIGDITSFTVLTEAYEISYNTESTASAVPENTASDNAPGTPEDIPRSRTPVNTVPGRIKSILHNAEAADYGVLHFSDAEGQQMIGVYAPLEIEQQTQDAITDVMRTEFGERLQIVGQRPEFPGAGIALVWLIQPLTGRVVSGSG